MARERNDACVAGARLIANACRQMAPVAFDSQDDLTDDIEKALELVRADAIVSSLRDINAALAQEYLKKNGGHP